MKKLFLIEPDIYCFFILLEILTFWKQYKGKRYFLRRSKINFESREVLTIKDYAKEIGVTHKCEDSFEKEDVGIHAKISERKTQ